MKVIKEGYVYEVGAGQVIQFMGDGRLDGATTEELLAVLRSRIAAQHKRVPCRHTGSVIQLLDKVSAYMEARQGQREALGLVGTTEKHDPITFTTA